MIVYSKPGCVQCRMTTKWLDDHGADYDVLDAREHVDDLKKMGHLAAPVVALDSGESFSGFRPDRLARALVEDSREPPSITPTNNSIAPEEMTPIERIRLQQSRVASTRPTTANTATFNLGPTQADTQEATA